MTDKDKLEKVVKGLESLKKRLFNDKNILDGGIVGNALALLKAQEPVEPLKMAVDHVRKEPVVFSYECPVCMCGLQRHWVACPICGTKVKWDG